MRLSWGDRLELYTLPLLGHGTPIAAHDVGKDAPFILEAGISSSRRIADFWGADALAATTQRRPAAATPQPAPVLREPAPARPLIKLVPTMPALPQIEAALRPGIPPADRRTNIILRALA